MFNKKESHLLGLSFLYMSVKFQNIHSEGCRSPLKDLFWSQASILETTNLNDLSSPKGNFCKLRAWKQFSVCEQTSGSETFFWRSHLGP